MTQLLKKTAAIAIVLGAALASTAANAELQGSGWKYGMTWQNFTTTNGNRTVTFMVDWPEIEPTSFDKTLSANVTNNTTFVAQQYCANWAVRNGPWRINAPQYTHSNTDLCEASTGGTFIGGVFVDNN
jgi:hypothetical protein